MNAIDLTAALTNPTALALTKERIAITTEAARRAGSHLASAAHRPVFPPAEALAALDAFRRPLQDGPLPAHEVLAELDAFGSPASVVSTHGRYFGFVNGGTLPAAAGAAILAGAWDNNAGPSVCAPASAVLDEVAGRWIVDVLGLPSTAVASFCAGATVANLTAIIAARDAILARSGWDVGELGLAGAPAVRVVIGAEAHTSVVKALRLAGFGEAQIERVPTDEVGAIDADAFPETDELTLVVLQAGNVNTGASDPFERIIPSAREASSWVHVDGAFGLWAAASPTRRRLVAGVELADSWATDGHKWLNVPYDSGIVIVREVEHLTRAMRADASYLVSGQGLEPLSRGIQMSQRGRGVEAWAALASLGRHGLADLIDRTCDHAARFARLLAEGGAEILAQELNQVLVSFGDLTDAVIAAVQAEGTCWAGGSTWHGRRAMRISVSDAATTRDDVEVSARAILHALRSLGS
ncbi:MAG: aminotransferase class V-fold PLP-dependent enzyme [Actinomycetes bacterium]|nr:MAG: aspartate aminotransferase family protein [Actinomycetota bacterium]